MDRCQRDGCSCRRGRAFGPGPAFRRDARRAERLPKWGSIPTIASVVQQFEVGGTGALQWRLDVVVQAAAEQVQDGKGEQGTRQ